MSRPLMAYKGFVYRIETEELVITERYMTFHGSNEKIDLSEWEKLHSVSLEQLWIRI